MLGSIGIMENGNYYIIVGHILGHPPPPPGLRLRACKGLTV